MATQNDNNNSDMEGGGVQQEDSSITESPSTMMTSQSGMMAPAGRPRRKWRTPTQIVAYANLVIVAAYLMFLAVIIILVANRIPNLKEHLMAHLGVEKIPPDFEDTADKFVMVAKYALYAIICVLVFIVFFTLLELWIAWGLLRSTFLKTPPVHAIRMAKCWRCCNIFLLIFNFLGMGAFFIKPSSFSHQLKKKFYPQLLDYTTPSSSDHGSDPSNLLPSLVSHITSFEDQADHYTICFGGINFIVFCIRLLFIIVVHFFIGQLQSVGVGG